MCDSCNFRRPELFSGEVLKLTEIQVPGLAMVAGGGYGRLFCHIATALMGKLMPSYHENEGIRSCGYSEIAESMRFLINKHMASCCLKSIKVLVNVEVLSTYPSV